jgi:hypothetical protein
MIEALFEKDFNRKTAEPMLLVDGTEKVRALCIHAQNDPVSEIENAKHFVARVNRLQKGYAILHTVYDEKTFHSNLVMGVFFEDTEESLPLKILFRWIESLPG